MAISVGSRDRILGQFCGFVDEECVYVEKAHQISLMGLSKWLPEADCCKNFTYDFELERVKKISRRALQHQKHLDSYVNPIERALEYQQIMKKERITQSQLATKLGISRVRVNQYLALLKLPKEQQEYILQNGKAEMITERSLRKQLSQSI